MTNKYLEKAAGWRSKLQATNAGKAMGNLSGATNASVLSSLGQSQPTHSFNTGDKKFTPGKGGFLGLGKTPATSYSAGVTRTTGDTLASGSNNILKRLKDFKASKPEVSGARGILSKAIGMAKRNPLAAAGVALGAGVLAGKALPKKNEYSGY